MQWIPKNYGAEGKIENIKCRYHKAIKHLYGEDMGHVVV
jgi:hypothetical protein